MRITLFILTLLVSLLTRSGMAMAVSDCSNTSTGLVPLTDLGTGTYQGEMGGLYPGGSNEIPPDHLELGLELAAQVVARAADGTPDEGGLIGFISIGVSNTLAEFDAFTEKALAAPINPALVLVNGAQRGRGLEEWASNQPPTTWNRLMRNVDQHGVTPDQVQVAWINLPGRTRGPATLQDAREEIEQFLLVLHRAKETFPNLALVYLSSRIYGGYIPDSNSEPNAYNHGFEIKWLIEDQINGNPELNADPDQGAVLAPWIAWGPYLWADGTTPRSDGLFYACEDLASSDGVHPIEGAQEKVASLMMDHFFSDPTAAGWFPLTEGQVSSTTTLDQLTSTGAFTQAPTSSAVPQERSPSDQVQEQASNEAADSTSSWPAVLTGLGVGLALCSLVGLLMIRRSHPPSSHM